MRNGKNTKCQGVIGDKKKSKAARHQWLPHVTLATLEIRRIRVQSPASVRL
jgi:hypothetical protein